MRSVSGTRRSCCMRRWLSTLARHFTCWGSGSPRQPRRPGRWGSCSAWRGLPAVTALVQPGGGARGGPGVYVRAVPPVADLRAGRAVRVHGVRLAAVGGPAFLALWDEPGPRRAALAAARAGRAAVVPHCVDAYVCAADRRAAGLLFVRDAVRGGASRPRRSGAAQSRLGLPSVDGGEPGPGRAADAASSSCRCCWSGAGWRSGSG